MGLIKVLTSFLIVPVCHTAHPRANDCHRGDRFSDWPDLGHRPHLESVLPAYMECAAHKKDGFS